MSKNKRAITPHKGGRDNRLPSGRVSADELDDVKKAVEKSGLKYADWVVNSARAKLANKAAQQAHQADAATRRG